ncbi:helix-turn-helix domain-containing protein [Methylobacterium sp. J-070]|uniref:helix-turn-helix domain-containing protein n=1 Tax=Methylobacterium sp. J-070 TaxID=2836650 RepID=UPI001FBA5B21|nr:helix-turn-helix domain-containing protein [Methylobacterium sp. J-070]MCJ2049172.1 helix-turn-helix domain-containing protein [Methylobacterium sp. J-070]
MLQPGHAVPAPGPRVDWPPASARTTGDLTLARITPLGRVDHFPPGVTLYAEGDAGDFVYWVVAGMVRTTNVSRDGKRVVRGFHLSGEFFGMERAPVHASSAEAVSDTRAVRCSRSRLDALAASDSQIANELWSWLLRMTERAQDLSVLGRASATQKLAYFLIDLMCRVSAGRSIELPMSRTDIGDYLGLSSETVSRTFTTLRQDGLISTRGRYVTLLDPGALQRMSGGLMRGSS